MNIGENKNITVIYYDGDNEAGELMTMKMATAMGMGRGREDEDEDE